MDTISNSAMLKRLPLLVVLGATGTGKSKLAVQLAKMYNGEVISADSMQLYKGLDIVTNKVTPEEEEGVPHHCLGFLDPLSKYTVVEFRDRALPIIDRLFSENKVPVVVGGTHYYIESLLWKVLVDDVDNTAVVNSSLREPVGKRSRLVLLLEELDFVANSVLFKPETDDIEALKKCLGVVGLNEVLEETKRLSSQVENMSEEEAGNMLENLKSAEELVTRLHPDPLRRTNRRLHARLREVDPERAERLHYNDVRKIQRSLEVYDKNRMKHSDILKEQQESEGGSLLGGPLRYPNSIILWITAKQDVLDKRLNDRVDDMLSRGLVEELEKFHKDYNEARLKENSSSSPYTQGIFQSIGFKEFHSYLTLPHDKKSSDGAEAELEKCVEALKLVTRRYARRQIKWIRGRFLKEPTRQVPPVYGLDGTDPSQWDEKVLFPAVRIVTSFFGEGEAPEPLAKERVTRIKELKGEKLCRICNRIFIGDHQWEDHLKSKKHHAMVKKKQKLSSKT